MCSLLYREFMKNKWEQKRFLFCFDFFFWVMLTSHVSYHKHNMSFQLVNFTYPNAPCAVVTAANTSFFLFSLVYSSFSFQLVVFFFRSTHTLLYSYCILYTPFGCVQTIGVNNEHTELQRMCERDNCLISIFMLNTKTIEYYYYYFNVFVTC